MNEQYKLHSFAQSGNCYKIGLMLSIAGADWEPVFVNYLGGETRTQEWRRTINEMGEVPILEHDGKKLSQSGAILHYLADRFEKYGGHNENERQEILRWILFDNHKFTDHIAPYRWLRSFAMPPAHPEVLSFLKGRADAAIAIVEIHLDDNEFMVSDRPTIADFSLAGYLFYPAEETGYEFSTTHPHISRWVARMSALPGWRPPYDMLPGERIALRDA
jgi:glutathione S-transferase